MKKLLSMLVAAVLLPVAANADVLKNVNIKGEIQTIASDAHHDAATLTPYGTEALYGRGTAVRVLAGLSADLVEDVTANLTFQYANIWGSDFAAGRNVNTYWDQIALVEGNVVLHNLFCCLEATVGRQFYGDEDSAVMYLGPAHYNFLRNGYAPSLDAVKVTYGDDFHSLTLLAGRTNDTLEYGIYGGFYNYPNIGQRFDTLTIYGADWRANWTDALSTQLYIYDLRPEDAEEGYEHVGFWGAKVNFAPEAFRASAEYTREFAGHRLVKEHHDTGYLVKADIAADINAVTARGTFYYNKHLFTMGNYAPGLLFGHTYLMPEYIMEIGGLRLFNVGVDTKLSEKWTASLDGYSFQTRTGHGQNLEADLTLKYDHNEYWGVFGGVGYAKMSSMLREEGLSHDNFKYQLGMLIKF